MKTTSGTGPVLSVDDRSFVERNSLKSPSATAPQVSRLELREGVKIKPGHRDRLAVVYVRQSSPQQVLDHRESRELQYKLARRAVELGWGKERVFVIDQDQAHTATSAEDRLGFQQLLAEVSLNHVGMILGIEMSRLARSNKDWHQLLELCAMFDTLLYDADGCYDPSNYNDRLLLGLK